jgi:pseudouridine-5'-phosphate glycosidase
MAADEIDAWIEDALRLADAEGIQGNAITPFYWIKWQA